MGYTVRPSPTPGRGFTFLFLAFWWNVDVQAWFSSKLARAKRARVRSCWAAPKIRLFLERWEIFIFKIRANTVEPAKSDNTVVPAALKLTNPSPWGLSPRRPRRGIAQKLLCLVILPVWSWVFRGCFLPTAVVRADLVFCIQIDPNS